MDNPRPALIALGSNLGDSVKLLELAIARLEALSVAPIRKSSFWRSAPEQCPPGSPDFVNAAVLVFPASAETPESLLTSLQALEREFGRRAKQVLNEPRPLDLDLIAFGTERRAAGPLLLPHPRAHLRRFVLAPLAEIAPDFVFPGQKESVARLLEGLGPGERVEKIVRKCSDQ